MVRVKRIVVSTVLGLSLIWFLNSGTPFSARNKVWDIAYSLLERMEVPGAAFARTQRNGDGCFSGQPAPPPAWAGFLEWELVPSLVFLVGVGTSLAIFDRTAFKDLRLPRCSYCGSVLRSLKEAKCPCCGTAL